MTLEALNSGKHEEAPPAFLIMTNVDPEDWCAAFSERRKLIGRDHQADIPVRRARVSRRHAEIWVRAPSLGIRDLGSRSGTRINGVWLKANCDTSLAVGDRIWIGGIELEVVGDVPLLAQVLAESGVVGERQLESAATATHDPLVTKSTEVPYVVEPIRTVLSQLSRAELEILLWMGRGYLDDVELGSKLFRSPNTVRTQVNSIYRKLDVHSRADILGYLKRGK
jgi:DNA-binding CsgD family transcriptional regulator